MAEKTWTERELPILEAVAAAEEAGGDANAAARRSVPGLSFDLYGAIIDNLESGGYLKAQISRSWGQGFACVQVQRLLPAGKRAVGQWPSGDPGVDLVKALEALVDRTDEPEKKNRLRQVLDAVQSGGIDLAAAIAVELGKTLTGIR